MMRAFVIAPAQVHAELFGTRSAQRMIEGLDVQLRTFAKLLRVQSRVLNMPPHCQVGAVDLQHESRREQRRVFAAHRIGDGVEIRFFARIEVVAKEERHHSGRGRAYEYVRRIRPSERRLQVLNILLYRRSIANGNRRIARRALAPRTPGVPEHTPGNFRETNEVLVDERVARPAESVQPVLDVRGIARLRQLAIVHDVDSAGDLLLHHLPDGRANSSCQGRGIDRQALLLCKHHLHEIGRPGQAARMGGEEPIDAALHGRQRPVLPLFRGTPYTAGIVPER